MLKQFAFVFCILCFAVVFARADEITIDPKAPAYHNARFGFSISWMPGSYTVIEADNGDGITVTDGKGFTMLVYAALDPRVGDVTRDDFFAQVKRTPKAAYSRINKEQGWYALSYVEDGKIVYTKQFFHKDHWPTVHFEYPQSKKKQYNTLVDNAVSSFKPFE